MDSDNRLRKWRDSLREPVCALLTLLALLAWAAFAAPPAAAQEAASPAEAAAAPEAAPQGESIQENLEEEGFHYLAEGRRDPFKPLTILTAKKVDVTKLPPIRQFSLDEIKITGVILDEIEGPRAMIKSPAGGTYVVKQGTIIGKNEGEVIEVTMQGIRVVEKFIDFAGNETLKEVFIKARPDKK